MIKKQALEHPFDKNLVDIMAICKENDVSQIFNLVLKNLNKNIIG